MLFLQQDDFKIKNTANNKQRGQEDENGDMRLLGDFISEPCASLLARGVH